MDCAYSDTRDSSRKSARKHLDSGPCNLLWSGGFVFSRRVTRGNHVRLQEHALEDDVLVMKSLDNSSKSALSGPDTILEAVFTIHEHFWLNNRHESILLTDGSIASQRVSILLNSKRSRTTSLGVDLEDSTPLGKASTCFVVFLAPLVQSIETLSGSLGFSARNIYKSL